MKHKHYAPTSVKCVLVSEENKIEKFRKIIEKEENICIIALNNTINQLKKNNNNKNIAYMNGGHNLEEYAKNIFKILREIDRENSKLETCYIEGTTVSGIGIGIMNRVIRACEYKVI